MFSPFSTSRGRQLLRAGAFSFIALTAPGIASAAPSVHVPFSFHGAEGTFPSTAHTEGGAAVAPNVAVGPSERRWRYCAPAGLAITYARVSWRRYHASAAGSQVGIYMGPAENKNQVAYLDHQHAGGDLTIPSMWSGCIYAGVGTWANHKVGYNRVWGFTPGAVTLTDVEGPAIGGTRTVDHNVTNGWFRPMDQGGAPPWQTTPLTTRPVDVTVRWNTTDNAHFRSSTGATVVNGRGTDQGNQANGTHEHIFRFNNAADNYGGDGVHTVRAWRAGDGWPTVSQDITIRVDGTPPVTTGQRTAFTADSGQVTIGWRVTDATSGVERSFAQVLIGKSWVGIGRVRSGADASVEAPLPQGTPDGTYTVRIVARDVAGNWQTTLAPDLVVNRSTPTAPAATSAARSSAAADSAAPSARRRVARPFRVTAEFAGGYPKTTLANARKGVIVNGTLRRINGKAVGAGAAIRITQGSRAWGSRTDQDGRFAVLVKTGRAGVITVSGRGVATPVTLRIVPR